jgi:uncharacterized protein YdiU (UPF0061 family)
VPRPLDDLRWDNSFARLPETFYQRVQPTPLPNLSLVAFNPDAAALLDLEPGAGRHPAFLAALNGDHAIPGSQPLATIYAGHQFGVWVPQLGDGRAILLGEVIGPQHQRWDVQLKGAGPTRFSRMGDGRAVLRSTIREYLAGEAVHGLGIPTTRSLAIAGSDAPVYREQAETAALLVRLAPTHVRFGSFELFASRGMIDEVRQLANYVIDMHFAHLRTLPAPQRYAAWYREVVDRTARLMAAWTASGFTHGVMNTDNMSILGLTLDYGPYGWMDAYDRGFIPNHSDPDGRYAFDQQPQVGLWNCARLGEALHSLVDEDDAVATLQSYRTTFEGEMDRLMRAKLGLTTTEPGDVTLVAELLGVLHDGRVDYTRFFRALSRYAAGNARAVQAEVADPGRLNAWLARYTRRLRHEDPSDASRHQRMLGANPKFVLRNWMAQEAIASAETGNFERIEEIRTLLKTPFDEHENAERYAAKPPDWAREITVSCSS